MYMYMYVHTHVPTVMCYGMILKESQDGNKVAILLDYNYSMPIVKLLLLLLLLLLLTQV